MQHRIFTRRLILLSAMPVMAFAQAQLSTTTGISSTESPGVFTGTQLNQPNQFVVGNGTPAQIWSGASKFTDAVTAVATIPSGSSVYQSNAVNGYSDNYSTATAGVAGYFTARCSVAGSLCWGINPQVTDRNDSGALNNVVMYGQETDVDVVNSDTAVSGLAIVGNFFAQPKSAWAIRVTAPQPANRWKVGYETADGAIVPGGSGISLGATDTTANSYSQILGLVGIDSGGVHRLAYLQASPSGAMDYSATPGTFHGFYGAPVALNVLAASTSNAACLNGSTWNGLYLISLCSSLRKYKSDIEPIASGLDETMKLTPVSYVSKTNGNHEVGFVAEDVEKVDKRLATYNQGELTGVQYDHMVALLTKAIQEQQAQIEDLKREIRELKAAK
jgi:hypothetical protein